MSMPRRTALKLGLTAGAIPLLGPGELGASDRPGGIEGQERRPSERGGLAARPLPLEAVRLTGGPLGRAQPVDAEYLLELDPDRMLAHFRSQAGLEPRAEPYGGWDGGGRNLTGHIAGHHLSAVSLMYAATGDERFRERAAYLVAELEAVQEAHGDGYLSALEGGRDCFGRLARGEIESASFDLNGEWSPWYTLHKLYAGLRDAWRYTGNRTALELEGAFAGWAEGVLSGLSETQLEHMMNTEFGGMNEVFVDLWEDTGDERWLALSRAFEHDDLTLPLKRHVDVLPGKHGNTQIPKLIGSADRFALTGDPGDGAAAAFFWDVVVRHHTFATGGHGKEEYFGPPDRWGVRVDGRTAETCNVYNMLKLTRRLFALRPDAEYADFHERALFNHILGSIDPDTGETCYMVPVGRGVEREYQDMFRSFTCCVGSGMESHALHGLGLYYEDGERLWVNLYAPSTATWAEKGVRLEVETDLPLGEEATLRVNPEAPVAFTLALRRPHWVGEGFRVRVNGEAIPVDAPGGEEWRERRSQYPDAAHEGSRYVEITRTWRSGDVVEITLPKTLRLEPTPDLPERAAILWGPLVLAGDLGPELHLEREEAGAEAPPVPVLVAEGRPPEEWLEPVPGRAGRFRSVGVGRTPDPSGRPLEVELEPFHRLHHRRYTAYWDLYTADGFEAARGAWSVDADRRRALEAATVDRVRPGVADSEEAHGYRGEGAGRYWIEEHLGRWAGDRISYRMAVEDAPMALMFTVNSDDRRYSPADFRILVEGELVREQHLGRTDPHRFFDVVVPIPAALASGREAVEVRFEAGEDSRVPPIYDVRTVRAEALPPGVGEGGR